MNSYPWRTVASYLSRLVAAALLALVAAVALPVAQASAAGVDNSHSLYVLDGFGGVHPAAGSPALAQSAYWPGWDIARSMAVLPDGSGGVVMDGWGGLHPYGTGFASFGGFAYWPGWDIARAVQFAPWATRQNPAGWTMDGWGGLHPFGGAPTLGGFAYWPGWDIARSFVILPDSTPASVKGYTVDGWGGIHPIGGAPVLGGFAYWPGWDIARGITLSSSATASNPAGWTLDGFGGVHSFGSAPAVALSAYWPGWDIARGIVGWNAAGQQGGWVLDGWGALHQFGSAPAVSVSAYWPGWSIANAAAGAGTGSTGKLYAYSAPPAASRTLAVPYYAQTHLLSCEAAALEMALAWEGRYPSQNDILSRMNPDYTSAWWDSSGAMHWTDPYSNFVGNPDGHEYNYTGYGTYYPVVQRVAQSYGASVLRAGEGVSPADVYNAVLNGHPVVAWVGFNGSSYVNGGVTYYVASDGRTVMFGHGFEHAVTVIGVNATSVLINNPWGSAGQQWMSKSQFEATYATFNDMAVIIA